ncbi:amino acid adenylation domain-containing protein [Acidobacteriota bacterium]
MTGNIKQVVKRFETQAGKYKEQAAVKTTRGERSYEDLNRDANRVAFEILSFDKALTLTKNVEKIKDTQTICLLFEHGLEMIIGIIGTLKAGKIYVPLDPAYPEERLLYMLEDSGTTSILTDNSNLVLAEKLIEKTPGKIEIINIDTIDRDRPAENPEVPFDENHFAYIMYTSGSTGTPKGVIQTHQNIVHFVDSYTKRLNIKPSDRILLLTSYSHTVSAIDIFSALLNGATICPYDIKSAEDMNEFSKWIYDNGITIYHSVPTVFRFWLDSVTDKAALSKIRLVVIGGEEIYRKDVEMYKRYFPDDCIFVNLFGSSEVIIATANLVDKQTEVAKVTVPIGFPVDGVEILIVDEDNEEAGVYGVGELVYKSDYLSPGYWNMPGLTDELFGKNVPGNDEHVFQGGDLGRCLPDGCIEYLGRKDFQVKISGHRIEAGEIESVLNDFELIKKSIVHSYKNEKNEYYLVAFYLTEDKSQLDAGELKTYLRQKLPYYMIPAYYVLLEEIPLTPNGKVEKKALPKQADDQRMFVEYTAPRNEIEEKVVDIWQKLLQEEKIGINDNFFALGGNSLKATEFIALTSNTLEIKLSIRDIFDYPTAADFSSMLLEKMEEKAKVEEILKEVENAEPGDIK